MSLDLAQNGTNVNGLLILGQIRGNISGTVRANNLLTMTGQGVGGPYTVTVSYWDTGLSGSEMTGFITYTISYTGINGTATIETRILSLHR